MDESDSQRKPEARASGAITLPPSLDDQSVEQLRAAIARRASDAPLVMNARHCVFATPYALAALLAIGEARGAKATFVPPENVDTAAYWAHARFFRFAEELYEIRGKVPAVRWASESNVMLEMTRIPADGSGGAVVARVERRVVELLVGGLRMEAGEARVRAEEVAAPCRASVGVEGRSGWVMGQIVHYRKRAAVRGLVVGVAGGAGEMGFSRQIDGKASD